MDMTVILRFQLYCSFTSRHDSRIESIRRNPVGKNVLKMNLNESFEMH